MYYTVYKITNQINNKIYIGIHRTKKLNDGYMGSGSHLKYAKEKYGIENFSKEILHVFDNADDMFDMETTLVNEEFVLREDTYNLAIGGPSSLDYINSDIEKLRARNRKFLPIVVKAMEKKWGSNWGAILADMGRASQNEESYKKISNSLKEHFKSCDGNFLGKKHSQESKDKIGQANSIKQAGKGNSQYGKMWIHSLGEKKSRKILKTDEIPDGWIKGRKIKF